MKPEYLPAGSPKDVKDADSYARGFAEGQEYGIEASKNKWVWWLLSSWRCHAVFGAGVVIGFLVASRMI